MNRSALLVAVDNYIARLHHVGSGELNIVVTQDEIGKTGFDPVSTLSEYKSVAIGGQTTFT